jgi:hypothetical protein
MFNFSVVITEQVSVVVTLYMCSRGVQFEPLWHIGYPD